MAATTAASGSPAGPGTGPDVWMPAPADDVLLSRTESWFIRLGLPYFIQDYAAAEDVFTRALPVFAGYFVVNLMLMLTLKLSPWERVCGAAAGILVLLAVYAVRNLARKRSAFSRPRRVSWVELALFAVVPPVVAVPARMSVHYRGLGRWRLPLIDLGVNIGVIIAVYVLASALLPLARWATKRTFQELGEVFDLALRALPLLFLFNAFLFISKDVWEFAGEMPRHRLWAVVGLFAVFTMLFLLYRLPDEVQRVAAHDDRSTIAEACVGTPMEGVIDRVELHVGKLDLDRRQKANILGVLFVGQMLQVVLLAFLVLIFFIGFGLLTFSTHDLQEWTATSGTAPHSEDAIVFGHDLSYYIGVNIDNRLLQVSIFLSAVSAFFFSVSSLTDDAYKEQFYTRMNHELETAIQVRRVYLALYEGRHRFDGDRLANSHMRLRLPMFAHEDDDPDVHGGGEAGEDSVDDGWTGTERPEPARRDRRRAAIPAQPGPDRAPDALAGEPTVQVELPAPAEPAESGALAALDESALMETQVVTVGPAHAEPAFAEPAGVAAADSGQGEEAVQDPAAEVEG